MTLKRGQSLLEFAICLPIVLSLGLGSAAVVQVADASTGLKAATAAAASAAARAPDAATAAAYAEARFASVISDYPVRSATLELPTTDFSRGSIVTLTGTGFTDVGWSSLALMPARVQLRAQATFRVEPWRTRR
jgi:Flp pilus assembly protein TadG